MILASVILETGKFKEVLKDTLTNQILWEYSLQISKDSSESIMIYRPFLQQQ